MTELFKCVGTYQRENLERSLIEGFSKYTCPYCAGSIVSMETGKPIGSRCSIPTMKDFGKFIMKENERKIKDS